MKATFKKGDKIVITDPCYIETDETRDKIIEAIQQDRDGFEERLNQAYLDNSPMKLVMRTGFGDWNNKMITWGNLNPEVADNIVENRDFCADSGMVCAIALSDLEKYYPEMAQDVKDNIGCSYKYAVIDCFDDLDVEFTPDVEWSTIAVYMSGTRIPVAESLKDYEAEDE